MHCSAFRSVTSFPILHVVFTTVFQKLNSYSQIESSANKKKGEFTEKMWECFFVNSNLFAALIGSLTTAVSVIHMTIQPER